MADKPVVSLSPDTLTKLAVRDFVAVVVAVSVCTLGGAGIVWSVRMDIARVDSRIDAEHQRNVEQDENNKSLAIAITDLNKNIQALTVSMARLETKIEALEGRR